MKALITGAGGFIGAEVVAAFLAAGHEVVCCGRDVRKIARRFPNCEVIACDFTRDVTVAAWLPRLENVDCVINCVGILHAAKATIAATHTETPCALFKAAVEVGVKRVIQLSALGASEEGNTLYATTKAAADTFLLSLPIESVVLRPSLVYGTGSYGGTSLFRGLAGLPLIVPVIGDGQQAFQPVLIRDLANTMLTLAEQQALPNQVINVATKKPETMQNIILLLRSWLGFKKPWCFKVPLWLIWPMAKLMSYLPSSPINITSMRMLQSTQVVNHQPFYQLLPFEPKSFAEQLSMLPSQEQDRWHSRLFFLKPALRITLGLMWLLSGLIPLTLGRTETLVMIHSLGLSGALAHMLATDFPTMDIILGVMTLAGIRLGLVAWLQVAFIVGYTMVLTLLLPVLWLQPFAPLLKNIPLLVATMMMWALEEKR